jgi:hypothetical protein
MLRLLLVALAITPEASALRISLQALHMRKESTKKIWVLYEFKEANPFVELNFDTWRKHAPEYEIMLINDTNIGQYVPDLPNEYFQLPYSSAKSDFLRAAILYHQGGVYMDTDFLMMKPLSETLDKLQEHDIVAYSDKEQLSLSGACNHDFSSNFMAGIKGNEFSRIWYDNIKLKLTRVCEKGDKKIEKICCHEEGDGRVFTAGQARTLDSQCHIPWAQLEHLKTPWKFPDDSTRKAFGSSLAQIDVEIIKKLPSSVKLYCYAGDESFTPKPNGELFWQPWDKNSKTTLLKEDKHANKNFELRYDCKEKQGTLGCTKTEKNGKKHEMTMDHFFDRAVYHLFSSSFQPKGFSKQEILDGDWLLSDMYRRALQI